MDDINPVGARLHASKTDRTPAANDAGTSADWCSKWVASGKAAVAIPLGKKGPTAEAWQQPENAITTVVEAAKLIGNWGIHHVLSNTAALDIDDWKTAAPWLKERGVDLGALWNADDAVRLVSGRPNRGKLIFRLPSPLQSKKPKGSGLELRCASSTGTTLQDVGPGSIHPETGKPYRWDFASELGDWRHLPLLPAPLLKLWHSLLAEVKEVTAPSDTQPLGISKKEAQALLARLDPNMKYDDGWLDVGLALHHEFRGSEMGLDLWNLWSSGGAAYKDRDDLAYHYNSFGRGAGRQKTIRSVMGMANVASVDDFDDLVADMTKPGIVLRPIADIVAEKREPLWLLDDVIEQAVLAILAGPRNTFKSFIASDWLYRAALAGHGAVILSGEGAGLDRRTDAWMRTNAPGVDLASLRIVAYERPLALNSAKVVAELVAAIRALPWVPKLILVDTFSKFSPGLDENDNPKVAEFLTRLGMALRDEFGCTLLLVAHSGHSDPGRPRGASSLMANPDAEYIVARDPLSMFATVTRERFKDTPSLPPLNYEAVVVDLGRVDSRGRQVSSLAMRLTHAADAPRLPREPTGKNQKLVWSVVQEQLDLHDGKALVEAVVAASSDRMTKPDGRDTRRQRAQEALESLQATGFVAILNDQVALT